MSGNPGEVVKRARLEAGLTQSELAARLSTTQSAIARLESRHTNPRYETLRSTLAAMDRRLDMIVRPIRGVGHDETLFAAHLRLTPLERVRAHDAASRNASRLLSQVKLLPREP